MIKKSSKSINIENIDNKGGTINFYTDEGVAKDKKNVSIAARDENCSPLECEVSVTKFGQAHKVSASVTNPLFGQRIYQKYLVFKDEKKARETMDFIASVFNEIKDEAEVELKHSAWLIPKFWSKLSNISGDADIKYRDSIDDSIRLRYDNNQFDSSRDKPDPHGWVGQESKGTYTQGVAPNIAEIIGAPSEYTNPERKGVMASNSLSSIMIKTSSSICGGENKNRLSGLSRSYINLFTKISSSSSSSQKKRFSTEEAKTIAHKIGIRWDVVKFSVEDFRKGLDVEIEHDNDPQTDVVRDDDEKWESVGKIAWRHLKESPEYYKALSKMEKSLKD